MVGRQTVGARNLSRCLVALLAPEERAAVRNGVGLAGRDYHRAVRQLCNRIGDGMDPFAASVQPLFVQYRIDLRRQRRLPPFASPQAARNA